jgi:drug/metabolite transporter (DMT)-like permease
MSVFIDQLLTFLPARVATIIGLLSLSPVLTLLIAHLILKFDFKAPRVMAHIVTVLVLVGIFCAATILHQRQYVG